MSKYRKIFHHISSKDVRRKHQDDITQLRIKEEKKIKLLDYTSSAMEEVKYDWRSGEDLSAEIREAMTTANVYQKLGTHDDGEIEDQVIDASLEASFEDGPDNGLDNIMFRATAIKDGGTGTGNNGGFDIGKHLAFSANTNSDGSAYQPTSSRHALLAPIDARNTDTITITAIRGNDSNGGELPDHTDEELRLMWFNTNSTGTDGGDWMDIDFENIGVRHNVISPTIIPQVYGDSGSYDGSFPGLRDWTITIPDWCKNENQRFGLWQLSHSGKEYDHYGITKITYRARTPSNAFVALDKPEASSFVRFGTSEGDPKKRKKKLEDQLKASKEYTDTVLGTDFPGGSATLSEPTASPIGYEQLSKTHIQAGTLSQQLKKALAPDKQNDPDAPKDSKALSAIKAAAADNVKGEVGEKDKYGKEEHIKTKVEYDSAIEEVEKITDELKNVKGFSDSPYKKIRSSRDLPTNEIINSVAEVLRKATGGFSLPVDLTLKYALGDMTPVTKSPGKAYDKATLDVLRTAHLSKGIGEVGEDDYGKVDSPDSLFGKTVAKFQSAAVFGAKNKFSYQVTSDGIRILDTFNFEDPKNPDSTNIGSTLGKIPGAQALATNLVKVGDWKAKYTGNDPRDKNYGIPIDYVIPITSLTQSDKDIFYGKAGSDQRKWVDSYNNIAQSMSKSTVPFQNRMNEIVKEKGALVGQKDWEYKNLQKKSNQVNEFVTEYGRLANSKNYTELNSLLSNENIPSYVKSELGGIIPQYNDKGEVNYEPLKNESGATYNPDHEISEETLERFRRSRIHTSPNSREKAIAQAPYAYQLGSNDVTGASEAENVTRTPFGGMKTVKVWGRDTNLYEAAAYSYWDGVGWTPSHVNTNHWQGHAPDGYFSRAMRYLYDPELKADPEKRARYLDAMNGSRGQQNILNGRSVGEQIAYYRSFGKSSWYFAKDVPDGRGGTRRTAGYYKPGETYYQNSIAYWKERIEAFGDGETFVDFFDTPEWKGTGTDDTDIEDIKDTEDTDTEKDTEDTDTDTEKDTDKDTDPKTDEDKVKTWIKDLGLDEPIFTSRDSKKKKKESVQGLFANELKKPDNIVNKALDKLGKTGETFARYLTNTLPEKIDNEYLGDKHVNKLIKKGEYDYQKGVLSFGDQILGTTQPPTREGNQIVVKFNYDFNNNAQEMATKGDTVPEVQKVYQTIIANAFGKYTLDANPALFGGVPVAGETLNALAGAFLGKIIEYSKNFGGGKHTPGELRIDVQKLKKENRPLYNDLSVQGLITSKDDGLVPNSKVVKEDIIRWRNKTGTPKPMRKRKKSNYTPSKISESKKENSFDKIKKVNKSFNYQGKPSADGFPDEDPPELDSKTGMHPRYGKNANRYKKLDPISANSMPKTGDPEIDATVEKQKKAKKTRSNWREELEESQWSPVQSSRPTNSTSQTFQHVSGTTATFAGLGGVEVHPSNITIDGENVSTPTYSDLALAGYAKPLGGVLKKQNSVKEKEINSRLDSSEKFAKKIRADKFMKGRVNPELSYPTDIQKVYGYRGFGPAAVNDGLTDNQLNSKWIEQKQIQDDRNKKVTKLQRLMTHDNRDKIQKQLDDLESEYFKNMVDHWNNWESLAQQGRGQKDPEPVTPKVTKDDEGFLNKVASTMQVGTAKRVFDHHMNFIKNPTNKPQDVTNLISSKDMNVLKSWAGGDRTFDKPFDIDSANNDLKVFAQRTPGLKNTLGNMDLDRGDGITNITPEYIEIKKAYDFDGVKDIFGAGNPLTGSAAAVYGGSRMGVKGMFQGTPTMYITIKIPRKKRETK